MWAVLQRKIHSGGKSIMRGQIARQAAVYILIILILPAFFLGGCKPGDGEAYATATLQESSNASGTNDTLHEESVETSQKETTLAETEPVEENSSPETNEKKVDYIYPVEGVRPYAVMIDNGGKGCLPQGGLDKAQIIYEVVVEYGITRLMPVFWNTEKVDEPELIGPVRSSRHYFLDYAMEHDAIYIHFGWSPLAKSDISKLKINNANGVANGGEIFWDITNNPKNWQDSYTSIEKIEKYVQKAGYRTITDKSQVFEYNTHDVTPDEGQEAKTVNLKYSSYVCSYEYNEETASYKRFRMSKEHIERTTGNQLEAKNIIIQYVKNYRIAGDTEDRQNLDTVGRGTGYYITCGKVIKIKWSKAERSSQTSYTDEKGEKIKLNPGQTWIQIMPLHGKVTIK
jgi:hypothetical protein